MNFTYQRSYRGRIKLAVFDWAGTTVDYGCYAPAAVFIEGYRRKGIAISINQARAPMGMEKRAHIQTIGAMEEVAAQWQKVHKRPMQQQDVDELYAAFVPLLLKTLADYAALIPGTIATVDVLRTKGIKIGATTGYFTEAMAIVQTAAAHQGYTPDFSVAATQVSAGRPAPWMLYRVMNELDVYPPQAVVKIGDTKPDIEEGLNAAVWTVGVAKTGNEIGLNEAEIAALPAAELAAKRAHAYATLHQAGAHYVVDSIDDLPAVVDDINARLARGERP